MGKLKIDSFLWILTSVVIIATLFPCEGIYKTFFDGLTTFAIALLFFMHGAKLPLKTIIDSIIHWRLHLTIFFTTFVLFPILGIGLKIFVPEILPNDLYIGFLYLCTLPATVQSAIAFTSIAKGNVAAAVCSASASTLLGVFVTPMLVAFMIHVQSDNFSHFFDAITSIMLKLLLPFVLGHLSRRFIGKWIDRNKALINKTDRTSILLVVYVAFSDAVVNGIWNQIDAYSFFLIIVFSLLLLSIVLLFTTYGARLLKFSKEDEITIVFCGSKKSLASGIPMASVLFPMASVGIVVLPLMIFHQIQLMVCALLAARYAKRISDEIEPESK